MIVIDSNWTPREAVHPLDVLRDELKARGISQREFAKSLGMQPSNFNRMLKNKDEITLSLAIALERALGVPAKHWTALQEQYCRDLIAVTEADKQDKEALEEWAMLDRSINMPELCKRLGIGAYLRISEKLSALGDIFGGGQYLERQVSFAKGGCFKRSTKLEVDERNLNTWILLAQSKVKSGASTYNRELVDECAKELSLLAHQRGATLSAVVDLLAQYGIALVYQEAIGKTPIDGYSAWYRGTPMIAVALRHKDMDRFAFDVLHELAHLKLHLSPNADTHAYISITDYGSTNKEEQEANRYAEQALISDRLWGEICKQSVTNINHHTIASEIADKATKLGLSPSIALWRYRAHSQVYNIRGATSPKLVL